MDGLGSGERSDRGAARPCALGWTGCRSGVNDYRAEKGMRGAWGVTNESWGRSDQSGGDDVCPRIWKEGCHVFWMAAWGVIVRIGFVASYNMCYSCH